MRRLDALLALLALPACGQGAICGQGQAAPGPDEEPGAFLYRPDAVLDLALSLDADALAALPEEAGDQAGDVRATLAFDGGEWPVGLRLKGATSFRPITQKAAFKIDFGEWDPDATFFGVRRLTLNNMVQDESMLSESLTYWLHAAVGGIAPRQGFACVAVNGEDFGLYSVIETMDEQFVERWFDDSSGNLYEGGRGADVRAGRRELFEVEEQGMPTDRGDLEALIDAFDAATPETYLDVLGAHFALDDLLGLWAVQLFVSDLDSYVTRANNFLLYHAPSDGTWTMIPWGEDQAFREPLDPHDPYDPESPADHGRLFEDCLASPACADALDERIGEVVGVAEAVGMAALAAERRDLIADLSRADPRSGTGAWATHRAQDHVVRFVGRRPDQILEGIGESP